MTDWIAPQKPAEFAESRLITAILEQRFPINSNLPAERELAVQLGVTRPTLREALQRLARDGWLEIRQGKPTRVRNYWEEGNLGVLSVMALHPALLPANFVANLLLVRQIIAPVYTRLAVERSPQQVCHLLESYLSLPDAAESFAQADWQLHHQLTIISGNPIFTLILNGFSQLYLSMAHLYFQSAEARAHSQGFYSDLLSAAQIANHEQAEKLTQQIMNDSLKLWQVAISISQEVSL